jgi:hypothetical protein
MAARDYPKNDGDGWHSHWVVLTPTQACGPGALGVRGGRDAELPETCLPIFIDSPGYEPRLSGAESA